MKEETCLLLNIEATVTPKLGQSVKFGADDQVKFPAGINCRWDLYQAVRKHCQFVIKVINYKVIMV